MQTAHRGQSIALAMALIVGLASGRAGLSESLEDAWAAGLEQNQLVRAGQDESAAAGLIVSAARAARLPTFRTQNFDAFITTPPSITLPGNRASSLGGGTAALPSGFSILGSDQHFFPISITSASIPIYSGGRISGNIRASQAQLGIRRNQEMQTVLDLRLSVAESYIEVLRARRALETARSNVQQLSAFARDVRNRLREGLAIRSDQLAAEVSLANARLSEIQARTTIETAQATYNRLLNRPLTQSVDVDEIAPGLPVRDSDPLSDDDLAALANFDDLDEAEVDRLISTAMRLRPELAALSNQARSLGEQAEITRAGVRPNVGFTMTYAFIGSQRFSPQGIGAAAFTVDWTFCDFGATRRRAESYRVQEGATLRQRADRSAEVALEVRTRWLELQQNRRRLPVARLAVVQAEENVKVVSSRYREQLSNYTEVLDAENRRIQAINNYENAVYDEAIATFRLRRAVGDL
jgi:outer membrane protein TolC